MPPVITRFAFEKAPLDLSDSTLSITTSIPQRYIDDGALIFQLIVHYTDEATMNMEVISM